MSNDPDGVIPSLPTAGGADEGKSSWADIVGPCYTVTSFSRVLRLSPAQVADAADDLIALRLRTADDVALFPAFQVRQGCLCPSFCVVLTTFRRGVDDPWTWAQWLNAEVRGEPSHMSRLWAGDLDGVLRDAGHAAWAWNS